MRVTPLCATGIQSRPYSVMEGTGDEAVGRRLKKQREAVGMTQEQLATRSGVDQGSISKYESGAMQPSLSVLKKLSSVLTITSDFLLHGPRASISNELADLTEDFALALKKRSVRLIAQLSPEERKQALEEFAALLEIKAKSRRRADKRQPTKR
jgi:transcriptional regulator with XRE-family HTH domain